MILLVLITVFAYYPIYTSSPNSLCILLNFGKINIFLKILTSFHIFLHICALFVVVFCTKRLKTEVERSGIKFKSRSDNKQINTTSNKKLVKYSEQQSNDINDINSKIMQGHNRSLSSLVIVSTMSNVISWIPHIVILLMSLFRYQMSSKIIIYDLLLVIPLNAMLNSFLFSIITKDFRKYITQAPKHKKEFIESHFRCGSK